MRGVLGSPRSAYTILVVDDEPGVRYLLRNILTGVGYQVLEAKDGREAVRLVEASAVDLAIIDLVMPGQEGIETIQYLHRARPQLKIIAISGKSESQVLSAAEHLGAHASFCKPIQADELLHAVAGVLLG